MSRKRKNPAKIKFDYKKIMRRLVSGIVGLTTLLSGCATITQDNNSRLELIKNRNELICGVSGKIPGFSFLKDWMSTYVKHLQLQ